MARCCVARCSPAGRTSPAQVTCCARSRPAGPAASSAARRRIPARAQTLRSALRAALESLVISIADRAAEDAVSRWRDHPAGAALLDQLDAGEDAGDWGGSQFAADAGLIFGLDQAAATACGRRQDGTRPRRWPRRRWGGHRRRPGHARGPGHQRMAEPGAAPVKAENVTKRSIARVINFDDESLATVLIIGLLAARARGRGRGEHQPRSRSGCSPRCSGPARCAIWRCQGPDGPAAPDRPASSTRR